MDDALLMRGLQRFGDLLCNWQRFIERKGTLGDAIRKRRPVDQLHHERRRACGVLNAINVRNGRMIERSEQVRLTLGPREPLAIVGECVGQDFQRDVAPEFGVPRPIDLL